LSSPPQEDLTASFMPHKQGPPHSNISRISNCAMDLKIPRVIVLPVQYRQGLAVVKAGFVRTAAIGPLNMLRDERMAVQGKLRCGSQRASEGPLRAESSPSLGYYPKAVLRDKSVLRVFNLRRLEKVLCTRDCRAYRLWEKGEKRWQHTAQQS